MDTYSMTVTISFMNLGILGKALQRRLFIPLGRLTYSAFLVNTLLQLYHASSQKSVIPSAVAMNFVSVLPIVLTTRI